MHTTRWRTVPGHRPSKKELLLSWKFPHRAKGRHLSQPEPLPYYDPNRRFKWLARVVRHGEKLCERHRMSGLPRLLSVIVSPVIGFGDYSAE